MNTKTFNSIAAASALICIANTAFGVPQEAQKNFENITSTSTPIVSGHSAITKAEISDRFKKETLLAQCASKALEAGEYAIAESYAREFLSVTGATGIGGPVLAEALDAQGKDADAIKQYEQAHAVGMNNREFMLHFSAMLLKAGRWQDAVAAYSQAIPPATTEDVAHARLGSVPDTYLLCLDNNFSVDTPRANELNAAIHTALGIILDAHGEPDRSIEHFRLAMQFTPGSELVRHFYELEVHELQVKADFSKTHPLKTSTPGTSKS